MIELDVFEKMIDAKYAVWVDDGEWIRGDQSYEMLTLQLQ